MKRAFLLIAQLLLLPFLLFSCDQEEDAAPVEQILPLQIGNQWVYEVLDYDGEGQVLSTSTTTITVLRDTLLQQRSWYILSDGYIVRNSSEGYVYYNMADHQPVILYQSPSYGGIGYCYLYPSYKQWVLTSRTYQPAPLLSAAGNFSCYAFAIEKQHMQGEEVAFTVQQKDYVAPAVGLVRSDTYYADSDRLFRRQELVSYTLR